MIRSIKIFKQWYIVNFEWATKTLIRHYCEIYKYMYIIIKRKNVFLES